MYSSAGIFIISLFGIPTAESADSPFRRLSRAQSRLSSAIPGSPVLNCQAASSTAENTPEIEIHMQLWTPRTPHRGGMHKMVLFSSTDCTKFVNKSTPALDFAPRRILPGIRTQLSDSDSTPYGTALAFSYTALRDALWHFRCAERACVSAFFAGARGFSYYLTLKSTFAGFVRSNCRFARSQGGHRMDYTR